MGQDFCTVTLKDHDISLVVPTKDADSYTKLGYENFTSYIFTQLSKNSNLILDVGAHVGYYSLLARRANRNAVIFAIEPNSDLMPLLRQNTQINDVGIVNKALRAEKTDSTFYISKDTASSSLCQNSNLEAAHEVAVESISGNQLIDEYNQSILIKIDMQGFELEGLKSFGNDLFRSRSAKFVVAFNPKVMENAGFDPQNLISFFQDRRYRIYSLSESKHEWYRVNDNESWRDFLIHDSHANLVCIPEESSLTIATVLHSSGVGGTERCQVELVSHLVSRGTMVKTFIPSESLNLRNLLEKAGSSVEILGNPKWWTNITATEARSEEEFAELYKDVKLIRSIKDSRIELIHTQSSVIPQGAVAAALLDLPHVWSVHEFINLDHNLGFPPTKNKFGDVLQNLSDLIVCNSKIVAKHHFREPEKIKVIYPNPNVGPSVPMNRDGDFFVVGIVGNHNAGKGHRQLITAIGLLINEGYSFKLRIIGPRSEPSSKKLELLISEIGIDGFVEFVHSTTTFDEIYRGLDCVVVPSLMEAFGRIPFEASSYGLPVIYSDTGGMLEYMANGITGISFRNGDIEDLKSAIIRLALSKEYSSQLVENAQKELLDFVSKNNSGLEYYLSFMSVHREFQANQELSMEMKKERRKYIQRRVGDL
jgi:FkbM family methyltransferase